MINLPESVHKYWDAKLCNVLFSFHETKSLNIIELSSSQYRLFRMSGNAVHKKHEVIAYKSMIYLHVVILSAVLGFSRLLSGQLPGLLPRLEVPRIVIFPRMRIVIIPRLEIVVFISRFCGWSRTQQQVKKHDISTWQMLTYFLHDNFS